MMLAKSTTKSAWLLLLIAFAATASCQQAVSPKLPLKTSLCEVSKNPSIYDGKEIQFHAQFMTDHIERSLLVSDDCRGEAMLPYMAKRAIGGAAFDDASSVMSPMNLDESITATFTGVFHFAKNPEMCMQLNKEICRRSLEIDRVDDLVLTMTPKKQNHRAAAETSR